MLEGIIVLDRKCVPYFVFKPFYIAYGVHYRYECLIDESVSMKDVHERFEVIEQRGEIWVLVDKE